MKIKTILRTIGMLLVVVVFVSSISGCSWIDAIVQPKETIVEEGFDLSGDEDPFVIAFRSEKKQFDIDGVKLTYYYGFLSNETVEEFKELANYPDGFDIYISNEEKSIFVRHIDENFISEKYRIPYCVEDGHVKITFNCYDEVKIPSELFSKDQGIIHYTFYGENVARQVPINTIASRAFYYIKINDKIIIFSNFDEMNKYERYYSIWEN